MKQSAGDARQECSEGGMCPSSHLAKQEGWRQCGAMVGSTMEADLGNLGCCFAMAKFVFTLGQSLLLSLLFAALAVLLE